MATRSSSSINLLREFSVPLIGGIVVALIWANVSYDSYRRAVGISLWEGMDATFLVNEVFMAIFFGIAAVEITDSLSPGGSMSPLRKAVTPLVATIGGVVGPAAVYLVLNAFFGEAGLARGWGITTATDIALAWLTARFVFRQGHPAISFLLLLAIADDAIGLAIIAIFYPDPAHAFYPPALGLLVVAIMIGGGLRHARVASYWPYLLAAGVPAWFGLFCAHLHPALALVFVVPFMPHRRAAGQTAFDVQQSERSTLERFEHEWKIVVDFGLFFFGLANAGVRFSSVGTVTWMIFASLVVGKTVGIFGCGWLARIIGFPLPSGMTLRDLFFLGMTAGIGLTVALFVAGAAFGDGEIQSAARMGALASLLVAPIVLVIARLLPRGASS